MLFGSVAEARFLVLDRVNLGITFFSGPWFLAFYTSNP